MQGTAQPPLSALFLVTFDRKIGYALSWQKSLTSIDLDGVEFRSLPSGVHGVADDVTYFSHGDYVGVSAFKRSSASSEQRNATFVSVGVLVERTESRLGGAWKHIRALQDLSATVIRDEKNVAVLENYWNQHRGTSTKTTSHKHRGSDLRSAIDTDQDLMRAGSSRDETSDHPVRALVDMLQRFGPLVFPLHRAALLRKRILLVGGPPVRQLCHLAYCLSLLASHTSQDLQRIAALTESLTEYDHLFNVGIADIDQLADTPNFLACTSDSILADKSTLYDLVVKMPQGDTASNAWPTIFDSTGKQIKATRRDFDRLGFLASGIDLQKTHSAPSDPDEREVSDDTNEEAPLLQTTTTESSLDNDYDFPQELLETKTWKNAAYERLSRWTHSDTDADVNISVSSSQATSALEALQPLLPPDAFTILRYFSLLNSHFVKTASAVAEDNEAQSRTTDELILSPPAVDAFGLDAYIAADRNFVEELLLLYSGRTALVVDEGVRLCGLRIC